jgi:F-type H+-transporting ATPase subunit b
MPGLLLAVVEGGEEHNPLLPAWYDILWSAVCFAIIFVAFWKFVVPKLKELEAQRIQGIEAKLEQAERDRAEAHALLGQYREQLTEARAEASRIRTEAQSDRKSIVEEARVEAQREAERVTERTHAQLQAELGQARAQLSRDVGRIAVDLAGRVVGANLADTEPTRATVDRFLDDLERSTASAGVPAGAGAAPGGSGGSSGSGGSGGSGAAGGASRRSAPEPRGQG